MKITSVVLGEMQNKNLVEFAENNDLFIHNFFISNTLKLKFTTWLNWNPVTSDLTHLFFFRQSPPQESSTYSYIN